MQEETFMRMTIPECTQPETLLRLANHGIKDPLSGQHGDMLIKVRSSIFGQERIDFKKKSSREIIFIVNHKATIDGVHVRSSIFGKSNG